ncbi:MAG: hypothetical protein FJX51_10930, partial [Alphaproteobacteria bacterium]|nr:hypothetical protein [Alphaproteobacteria bacterium]
MSRLAPLVCLTLCGAVVAAVAQPAFAQTHYGARKAPNVTVDMTVLDELGAVPNVPQVLAPTIPRPTASIAQPMAAAPSGIVHLRPPSEKKRAAKTKAAP